MLDAMLDQFLNLKLSFLAYLVFGVLTFDDEDGTNQQDLPTYFCFGNQIKVGITIFSTAKFSCN
jgi:hypothetical protein